MYPAVVAKSNVFKKMEPPELPVKLMNISASRKTSSSSFQ